MGERVLFLTITLGAIFMASGSWAQGLNCRTNVFTSIRDTKQCECKMAVHSYNKGDLDNPNNFTNLDEAFQGQQEMAEEHVIVKGVPDTKTCEKVCRTKAEDLGRGLCIKNTHFDTMRGTYSGIYCSHKDTGKCCFQVISTRDLHSSCSP